VELDVPAVLGGASEVSGATADRVIAALARSDVVLYTSRTLAFGADAEESLAIARTVSAALARTVRRVLPARPAWIVAKGGITSYDVGLHGLGIRRAVVAGQLFPGAVSVFRPVDALPDAVGMPYVVFPSNVGDETALDHVVAVPAGAARASGQDQGACG
jgi:uncharacterized protein YgbK (DUF1537 family)